MTNFKVGVVKHYFDKLGVATVEVASPLTVGDIVRFVRGGEDMFEQKIDSIQVEHNKVPSAKKGDVVGLKVAREVKEGTEIFKLN